MSLETRVNALATQIGTDVKQNLDNIGVLANLTTTDKSNLVNAINEVAGAAAVGALLAANNLSDINDTAAARTNLDVSSTGEITAEITAAITAVTLAGLGGLDEAGVDARVNLIVDAAPAALDTLNEIAAALNDDPDFHTTITNSLTDRVSYSTVQTRTPAEQLQACENIAVGNPEADHLATYIAARDA